jgi:hypothetical protein
MHNVQRKNNFLCNFPFLFAVLSSDAFANTRFKNVTPTIGWVRMSIREYAAKYSSLVQLFATG